MIRALTAAALKLDVWLQRKLGRPYRAILSVGLTIEIVRRLFELPSHLREVTSVIGAAGLIAMNLALLVNQLGEMSHRIARREADRTKGLRAESEPSEG